MADSFHRISADISTADLSVTGRALVADRIPLTGFSTSTELPHTYGSPSRKRNVGKNFDLVEPFHPAATTHMIATNRTETNLNSAAGVFARAMANLTRVLSGDMIGLAKSHRDAVCIA